jgi:4-hydroxy-tetrahydrodipicolinate synthase
MIHVPLITPFGADGRLDEAALADLAQGVLADGAAGLVALGTTGEPSALEPAERAAVTGIVGRVCREHGARFTLGVPGGDTRGTARALAALAELPEPPDAALVAVPAFTRPGEAGVLAHFRALAAASPVPLVAYHVPYRTAQPLGAAALLDLAGIPGVVGVKYAAGGIEADAVELLGALGRPEGEPGAAPVPAPGFEVLAGDDVVAPALFALGAHGGILASAHLATARWAELAAGGGRALGHRLSALAAAVFREPNPAVVKAVLHARGRIPTPDVRLPLLPASAAARTAALAALERLEAAPATVAATAPAGG